jgi:hypothetical protein
LAVWPSVAPASSTGRTAFYLIRSTPAALRLPDSPIASRSHRQEPCGQQTKKPVYPYLKTDNQNLRQIVDARFRRYLKTIYTSAMVNAGKRLLRMKTSSERVIWTLPGKATLQIMAVRRSLFERIFSSSWQQPWHQATKAA